MKCVFHKPVSTLLGLTASKTKLQLNIIAVRDERSVVSSRCRTPSFRCKQSLSSLMLKLEIILYNVITTRSQKICIALHIFQNLFLKTISAVSKSCVSTFLVFEFVFHGSVHHVDCSK